MKLCLFPLQFKSSTPEMAGHRGRVYECIECGFREERSRVSSHVYKYHVPLSRVSFYCTLCAFRYVTNSQLKRHVVHYEPHVSRVRRFGPGACQNVLKRSDDPVLIGDHNVRLLTLAESVDHWDDRTVKAARKRARVDLLGEAMVMTELEPECKRIMSAQWPTQPQRQLPAHGWRGVSRRTTRMRWPSTSETSADDPIIQVISGEEFERELLHDSSENRTKSAETELVLLEALRGVGLGTESLVTNVQELTCRVGELTQCIPATVEERLPKLKKEVASMKTLLEKILDVARDAKYYARRDHMDSQPQK